MYLEPSEQSQVSGEGETSAISMPAELYKVPELTAANEANPSGGSAEPDIKALVEYTGQQRVYEEMDLSLHCAGHCTTNGYLADETEPYVHCNGHSESFEQYSTSEESFDLDQSTDPCKTSGLTKPLDECAKRCDCFKPDKSSEHCANHDLTSECAPCCEHGSEHLLLSQQCEASDKQFELFGSEPDEPENCTFFWQREMSDSIPDISEFTASDDSFDCDTEHCEYYENRNQIDPAEHSETHPSPLEDDISPLEDDISQLEDEISQHLVSEPIERSEYWEPDAEQSCLLLEEANSSHCNTPLHAVPDESTLVSYVSEDCEGILLAEERFRRDTEYDTPTELCLVPENNSVCELRETSQRFEMCEQRDSYATFTGNDEHTVEFDHSSEFCTEEDGSSEPSNTETKLSETCGDGSIPSVSCSESLGECDKGEKILFDHSSGFCTEEDGSSEYSAGETQSLETSLVDSIPAKPCSESSGESDKDVQEYSSDEHTDWESFEDPYEGEAVKEKEEIDDNEETESNESNGDQDEPLFDDVVIEVPCDKEAHGHSSEKAIEDTALMAADAWYDAPEDPPCQDVYEAETFEAWDDDCVERLEKIAGEWGADDQFDKNFEPHAPYVEGRLVHIAEENYECFVHELCEDKEVNVHAQCANDKDNVHAPCANDEDNVHTPCAHDEDYEQAPCAESIYVEGDAYEDDVPDNQNCQLAEGKTHEIHVKEVLNEENSDELHSEEDMFNTCTEYEPYLSCPYNGEVYEPDVEDYYVHEIRSVQSTINSCNQTLHGEADEDPAVCEEKHTAATFEITEVVELNESLAKQIDLSIDQNETQAPEDHPGLSEISGRITPPLDLIHSVEDSRKKNALLKSAEESEDSEEEQSDDESEFCECEYCIPPPADQVPTEPLLPQMKSKDAGKICVVIDLDETLVHSSFKPVNNADFIIPVEIDGTVHQVYVLKRPHVDEFLKRMGEMFECVLFTASLSKYADPVSDLLDKWGAFRFRLFREACVFHRGNYVKDLSRLGRELNKSIIIDNSPASYVFHPDNAVPVASWFDDMSDTELLDLIPFFETLSKVDDVYDILKQQQRTAS